MFSFRGLILARSTSPRRTAESGGRSEPLLERYRLLLFEGNARALEPHRGVHTDYLADAVMQNARVRPDRPYARDAIALGAAVGVFGASFGVLSITAGLSVARTCVMSLLVFTGASQFAAIGVVAGGGSVGTALGSALLLAARNSAYGLVLAPRLGGGRLKRLFAAHLTIDESAAMAAAQDDGGHARGAFWWTGVAVFAFWNIGTLAGALAGTALGDPRQLGLDAAFPAGFVVLVAPHLRMRRGRVAAASGAVIALMLVPLTPAGIPILAASLGVVPALLLSHRADAPGPNARGELDEDGTGGRGGAR